MLSAVWFITWPKSSRGDYFVLLGMRMHSQILIYVDVDRAMSAGIKFFLSANGVVLTEGDSRGFLAPQFFRRVEDAKGVPLPGWEGAEAVIIKTAVDSDEQSTKSGRNMAEG